MSEVLSGQSADSLPAWMPWQCWEDQVKIVRATVPGVLEDALRLKLFPYSLRDRARAWLNALPSKIVASWNDLCQRFLLRYNPPTLNAKLRNDITSFRYMEEETLYEAWEQLKELIKKCSMHGFQHWTQIEMFYNGLNTYTRMVVDASANGTLLNKTYNEAYEILEKIANNYYSYSTTKVGKGKRAAGNIELDAITSLMTQVSFLANMIKTMKNPTVVHEMKLTELSCFYCGENHVFHEYPSNPASIYYMGNSNRNSNPYSNAYNSGWKQYLNFSWGNQGAKNFNNAARQNVNNALPGYVQPMPRPQGALPSDTENSRTQGKEQCITITLRSGTQLSDVHDDIAEEDNASNNQVKIPKPSKKYIASKKGKQKNVVAELDQFKIFLEVLMQLHSNILLIEALEQMYNYVKFMIDILSKKHRLGEFETVALIKGCTMMLINKLPPKKLGIGKARPTTVTLQLAGRSYTHLEGKIENVLKGELTIRVNDQLVTFNVFDALKYVDENDECHTIDLIETVVEEFVKFFYRNSDSEDDLIEQGDTVSSEKLGEFMDA
ncbi:uncharacterized protein LOC105793184 [Gossypium raimondii]|uniref:uncharacterized protein LOC105793184 n=1 Tax=Gossypium raimondii TaxID=29730 RepID=UPI00063B0344|nr:uncharacterized protein LOC105793184 [Gossypium raimondii]